MRSSKPGRWLIGTAGKLMRRVRPFAWRAQGVLLSGDHYHCSVCLRGSRRFLPVAGACSIQGRLIDHFTPNAICPHCRSGIRQRLLADYLRAHPALIGSDSAILHVAPEHGLSRLLSRGTRYTALDLNPDRFPGAIEGDVTSLPANERYSMIVCSHVLEHLPDDRSAIASIFGALRPGGEALIAVPTYGDVTVEVPGLTAQERAAQYGCPDHYRLNGRDFADKLRAAGFLVEIVALSDPPAQTAHVESDRLLFVARKARR